VITRADNTGKTKLFSNKTTGEKYFKYVGDKYNLSDFVEQSIPIEYKGNLVTAIMEISRNISLGINILPEEEMVSVVWMEGK